MFIDFQVGNFRSFRDHQKFSMQAAPLRANDGGLEENNVFTAQGFRLLKTKAVYGSNASGKSNLGKAVATFVEMVSKSVSQEGLAAEIWEDRFGLLHNWDSEPVFFQYSFLVQDNVYRYGFTIERGVIPQEWLYTFKNNGTEEFVFLREEKHLKINEELFIGSNVYMDLALGGDHELFRDDSLFLTGAALNGNSFAATVRNQIRSIMTVDGLDDRIAIQNAMTDLDKGSEEHRKALIQFIKSSDVGINDLKMLNIKDSLHKSKVPKGVKDALRSREDLQTLCSFHSVYDDEGNIVDEITVPFGEWESEGTSKLLGIGSLVLWALREGRAILIDEFDARFHPNLTLKLVQLFHSPQTNPNNAQLIFITHDTGLMRRAELRRDQICLVNKDRYGISTLRTLIEYKGVRKDASYEKEYLNGSYDAVPYLNDLDWQIIQNLDTDGL